MDIYLRKNPTLRHRVPKDLAEFKKFAEKVTKSMVEAKKKLPADKQQREEDELDKEYERALSGVMDHTLAQQMTTAEKVVESLGWSDIRFAYEWRTNKAMMENRPFKRSHRVAKRRGEKFLVMSGLSWNVNSQNKGRDWPNIATAITLETALVESYRTDLLRASPGACSLRKAIKTYFKTIAAVHHDKDLFTQKSVIISEWNFPDDIPLDVGPCGGKSYDPDDLRKEMNSTIVAVGTPRGKRHGVDFIIGSLVKNKLLWSSNPKAPDGSLETLAYKCLRTLTNVSHLFISQVHLSRSVKRARSQIMNFNAARLAYEKKHKGETFDAESVELPHFEPKQHAKSEAFSEFVSMRSCFIY